MSQRTVTFVEGEFYHLYNRGNSKQLIFVDDIDRDRFVKLLYLCNSSTKFDFRDDIVKSKISAFDFERGNTVIAIGAWVLMPNHFHIYATIPAGNPVTGKRGELSNPISDYMHRVEKAYSRYFNARHKRTGSLFEGRFKSTHVNNDNYAKYLFSYIHLNPVKLIQGDWKEKGIRDTNEALNYLKDYKWSSFADFNNKKRPQSRILDTNVFPDYFPNKNDFRKEIIEWITLSR
ncbi:MAG: hypothetical protein KBC17_00095 [Candidatus Pacebacteria bacterium]|nr:hypothetical protein [Candidatus Paceibacterota bacterium]